MTFGQQFRINTSSAAHRCLVQNQVDIECFPHGQRNNLILVCYNDWNRLLEMSSCDQHDYRFARGATLTVALVTVFICLTLIMGMAIWIRRLRRQLKASSSPASSNQPTIVPVKGVEPDRRVPYPTLEPAMGLDLPCKLGVQTSSVTD